MNGLNDKWSEWLNDNRVEYGDLDKKSVLVTITTAFL